MAESAAATDPRGRSFLSYRRERIAEAELLIRAQREVGIPTWQDVADLGEVHAEEELRQVLADPQTANAVLWVSPEVADSAVIRKIEAPAIFERFHRGDAFFALIATAGGLDYRAAGKLLDPHLGGRHLDEHNCRKIESDPLSPAEAREIAGRVLASRLRAIHRFLPQRAPLRVSLMTRRPAVFVPAEQELALDWHGRFDVGSDHRQAAPETWEEHLLPALRTLRERCRASAPGRALHFSGLPSLPAAVALGCTFSSLDRFFSLSWLQKTGTTEELWGLDAAPEPSSFRVKTTGSAPAAEDLAVLVSVTSDVSKALEASGLGRFRALTRIEPPDRGKETYPFRIRGAGQAVEIARLTIEEVLRARREYTPRRVHLFLSVPSALAMMIGQQLNTLGPVQTYEHLQEGAVGHYEPAALVAASD